MTQSQPRGLAIWLGLLLAVPAMAQKAKDVCGDRPQCTVVNTQAALKGHEVVELSLGTGSEEEAQGSQCEQKEWWLRRPGKPVVKLLATCTGAAFFEDSVEVEKNRFIRALGGGGAQRWIHLVELQLSPLKWSREEHQSFRAVSTPETLQQQHFNYATFEGRLEWELDGCQERYPTTQKAQLVPQVQLPADFLAEGWKHTSLGRCSADGSFVLLGKAQGKEDARVRAVLAQGNVLLVEVVDDTWTGPGAKWLADDHVELWLLGSAPTSFDPCNRDEGEAKQAGLVQWGIRIADGQVFPAYGNPAEPLSVEVARDGKVARLKIQLPMAPSGLTVVYSDSDAGKQQELMVATSPLKLGRAFTLSPVWNIVPTKATCEVKANQLVPVAVEQSPKPGEAIIPE
ncbi:MAG TPA: hypothetical protein VF815_09090 [Myxococcaceae bacterium]|jgi:hypothetical protein